ncbi:MAG TPA: hypothetical protein VJ919_07315 [Tangfeifania sp.]|nr:hypothetical protein [Tangfeifania sp.]
MKRSLVVVVFLLLAVAAGFFFYSRDEISFSKDTSLYKAVPVTAPFFIEFNSLKTIPLNNPLLQELQNAGIWADFFSLTQHLDSLIENSEELPGSLRDNQFILSFGFSGRNDLVPLIIAKAESNNQKNAFKNLANTVFPASGYMYQTKEYGNHTITEIVNADNNNSVFYSFAEELLLIGTKSLLVEQAIRQLPANGILKDNYFREVNRSRNIRSEVSLYVNHAYFPDFAGRFLNGSTKTKVDEFGETRRINIRREMQSFGDFASWTELDFQFKNDHISLAGISAADDSLNHFLTVFADQEPVRFSAEDILPGNTSFFCSFAFSDKEAFFNRLDEYFTHTDFYYTREERMKRYERGFRSNIQNDFRKIVKDELIVASTSVPVDPDEKTTYFIVHTQGKSLAQEQFLKLLNNYASRRELNVNDMKTSFALDEEVSYEVYKFPYPSLPGIWLGEPFGMAQAGFMIFFGDFMVFSNSEQGIRDYARSMMLGATLTRNNRYQRYKQNLSNRANVHAFVDVNRAFGFKTELFSNETIQQLDKAEENIRKFGAISWQVQHEKDSYHNSLVIEFNPESRQQARTTWQSNIGGNIIIKPQLLVNHNDADGHEIIVQDENYNLHQITSEGRVRWTMPLSGRVMGEIHQVDYYVNGNLQYLFNTKEKLYLIDRNGNNVAHFPVDFSSPATNGANVFDYHNNRDYRYFIAHEDKSVLAYDKSGDKISGWVFGQTEHPVISPVQHFRIGSRDYIVFKDRTKIYIQNRRGETRVETSSWFENSKNQLALNLNGKPKIVATDLSGKVHYIYFDGTHEEKKTGNFSEDHFFTVDDLDGNNVPDFVFVDGNELIVMDENGKKLFDEDFDNRIESAPNIYTFGPNHKKVGIRDAASNRIYLFNPAGELHDGFPLQGNTEFSIGKLSEDDVGLSLVVGSEGGKLFNYSLN